VKYCQNSLPVLNTSLFIRYFIASSILIGVLIFLSSFSGSTAGLDEDILKYTNQFRRSKGLSTLEMRQDLNQIARKHSEDMARGRRSFGHGGFDQRSRKIRLIFKSCTIAENVAYGSRNAKEVVAMWKNSTGHRRNMLGDFKYAGIGTARDRRGTLYFTQIFVH
jgi:uncharacterized protein YkwD